MIEGLPWPVWGGLFASGWAVTALLLVNYANGRWFVSRREAESYIERAKHAEQMNVDLTKSLAGFTAVGQLQKAMLEAKERAVSKETSAAP
jgi:hypothetical protein